MLGRQERRPSIDPEAAVRLMLAGLFQHITKDRRLMREAQVNLKSGHCAQGRHGPPAWFHIRVFARRRSTSDGRRFDRGGKKRAARRRAPWRHGTSLAHRPLTTEESHMRHFCARERGPANLYGERSLTSGKKAWSLEGLMAWTHPGTVPSMRQGSWDSESLTRPRAA